MRFFPPSLIWCISGWGCVCVERYGNQSQGDQEHVAHIRLPEWRLETMQSAQIAFIYSLIVGISETIPGLPVDLLPWWVWPRSVSCVSALLVRHPPVCACHKLTENKGFDFKSCSKLWLLSDNMRCLQMLLNHWNVTNGSSLREITKV